MKTILFSVTASVGLLVLLALSPIQKTLPLDLQEAHIKLKTKLLLIVPNKKLSQSLIKEASSYAERRFGTKDYPYSVLKQPLTKPSCNVIQSYSEIEDDIFICFAPVNYEITQAEKQQMVIDHNKSCREKLEYYVGYLKHLSQELIEWVRFERYLMTSRDMIQLK